LYANYLRNHSEKHGIKRQKGKITKVDTLSKEQLIDLMASLTTLINRTVDKLPSHDEFLQLLK
jgi:hypothetical protein